MDKDEDREQGGHSIAFKVTVNQQGCDPKIDSLISLLVDTGATTHIITEKSRFCSFDSSFVPEKHTIELADGSRVSNLAKGRGKAIDKHGR